MKSISMNIKFIIILLFSIIFKSGLGQFFIGDTCTIHSSRANGVCKLISLCPSAIEALQTQQLFPTQCGFLQNEPIVCCVDSTTSAIITIATPPTITTPPTPTVTKVTPSTSTRNQNLNSQVGDISRQKCIEYGRYVYLKTPVTGLIGSATLPPIDDCAVIQVENIVGGTPAKLKEFPHMALVGFDDEYGVIQWSCGGSLISEKFVLSAAHCTYHKTYQEAKYILLGELVLDSTTDNAKPETISIKNSIRHPDYLPPSNYHDIALFELERDATLSSYIRPACLNTNPTLTNRLGVASGWGKTESFGTTSKELLKVTLDMFTTSECNHTYRRNIGLNLAYGIVEETQICAGSRNDSKDTCQGDSGGPLQIINKDVFCTYSVIGVTSFGKACGIVNFPGVYTRVSAYIKWIEDIVWP